MNLLKDLYKGLVQSANKGSSRKSSKGQRPKKNKKKEEKSTPRSKGDERRASLQTARQNNTKRAAEKKSETKQKSSTSVTQRKTGSGAIRPVGKAGVMGGNTSSNKDNKSKITVNGKPIGPATKAGVMGSSSSGKNPVKKKETKGFAVNGKTVRTFTKAGVIGGNKQGDKDLAEWKAQQKKNQGIKKNALGVEAKTHTGTWGNPVGESIVKAASHASTRARTYTGAMDYAKKSTDKEIKKAEKKYGYKFSEQEKKELRQDAFEDTRKQLRSRETQREINKEANKLAKDSGVKGGTYKAEELTSEDIIQAQNAYRLGGKYGQKMLGKELSKKLGSNIAYNTNKNTAARVAAGVLQGSSYGDTIHGGPATYGKEEKKAIKEATESGAYLAGYGAGIMGSFVTSGVGGVGKAIAQLGTKGAVKGATKATAKSAAKKFAQNRAGELAAETPLNALDAVKMSRDENGNIDKKEALKWMGFNTALTGGMGAAIEGAGMKLTKRNARKYIQLAAKQKTGSLTEEEGALFTKLKSKLANSSKDIQSAKSNSAYSGLVEGNEALVEANRLRAARAEAIRTGKPHYVGYDTKIDSPYQGPRPVHNGKTGKTIPIKDNDVQNAMAVMPKHGKKKQKAKEYAKEVIGKYRNVTVKNTSMDGQKYDVYLGSELPEKITFGSRVKLHNLAILSKLDDIISNAEYLDSGNYIASKKLTAEGKPRKVKKSTRYDYFETRVSIGKKNYVVSFDVEVNPSNNKYRAHRVSKMTIEEMDAKKTGASRPARATKPTGLKDPVPETSSGVNKTIPQEPQKVKSAKEDADKPKQKSPVGATERNPSASETRIVKKYDDAIKAVDTGDVDDNILRDIEVTKDGDTWREMTTGDELSPQQLKDRIANWRDLEAKTQARIDNDPRYAPFRELDDLDAEYKALEKEEFTPEVEKRADEITSRIDEISDELGGDVQTKRSQVLNEIRSDIWQEQYGGGKIPKSVTKADSDDALKAIEAQRASDETLVKNNEDVIKNSDDAEAGLERPIPDSGEMPKGLKRNVKAARPIKDQVQKQLASDGYAFTKAEKKEIDDAVETMSRRIANGDEAGAKADAEELVEKHFHFDAEEKEIDPNFKEKRRELRDIQQFLRSHAWDMPPGSARTLKEFLEFIGLPKSETRRLPIRKWSKKDSTFGKKGASKAVIDKGGKLPRAQIDDAWTSMSDRWPEYFPPETKGVEDRFIKMAEAAQRNAIDDFPEERIINTLSDAEIKEWKEAKVDEILDLARENAGTYRGVDEPKPIKPIDGLDAGQIEKRINNEKIHLENAIMKHGKDSPRVKEIEDWLSNAEKTLDEMRGETKAKPKEVSAPKPKEGATEKAGAKATKSELPKGKPVGYDEVEFDVAKMGIKDDAEVAASKEKSAKEGGPNGPKEPVKSVVGEDGVDSNFAKWFKDTFTSFRRLTESSLVGFERLAAKTGNKELRHQTTQAYLAKNRIASWIEGERAGFDRKTSGDGLNAIFEKSKLFGKKNKERRADFSNYLLYKHAIDRLKVDKPVHMAEGGGSKFTQEEYETLIKQLEDKYPAPKDGGKSELEVFADDVKAYFDDLMKYRVDAGLVSREFAETMAEKYPNYVPTYREGDEWIDILTEGESYRAGIGQSVKTAKGGSEAIEDLYQQMARITKNTIRDAEENALMNAYAKALGIKPEALPDKASLNDIADCAIKASEQGSGGWRVTFWDNGQPVTMGVNKQVAKGLREFNGQTFTRLVSTSSKLNRFGVAYKRLITDWNLIFGVRNGARDIQQAAVNSKDSVYFAKSIPSAWAAIASPKNNPYMRLYKANGGMYSALVQQGKDVAEPGTKNLFSKGIDNSIGHAIKAIEKTNGAIEIAPRLAEFIGTINKHANKELEKRGSSVAKLREEVMHDMFPKKKAADLTADELEKVENNLANKLVDIVGKDVIDRAMHNSADITLNFSRNGVIGKALNSGLVPYLNPSIQGLSKTFRLFSEGKGDKTLLNIAMKIGTLTIAPAVFNEVVLKDDKAYQSLNTRDKDTNFFIPIGDGKFIKIPKPRENAVLAEPVEYGLRYFFDKAHVGVIEEGEYSGWKDLGQMWKSAVDNIGPVNPLTDNLFSPLLHTAQNKTWYGGSIEDTSDVLGLADKSIKHSDVYNESTSATAKEIGSTKIGGKKISDIMHLSPKKIDNLMDSYLGIIYDLGISQTSDASHGNPFLNQFVKDSVFSNKNGTELWAEFDKANAPDTMAGKLKQKAKKAVLGNTKWTIQDKSIKAQDWLNLKGYDDITYSDARNKILYDKDLTPKQKEVYDRKVKKWQNDMRHELVYGKKEVTPEMDPIRKISGLVGVDKAMKDYTYTYVDPETGEKKNQHLDAWKAYKKSDEYKKDPKKADGKFIDFYSKMRWTNGRIGESKSYPSWMTASVLAATEKGKNDDLAKAYIRPDFDKDGEYTKKIIQRGKNYRDYGFTQDYYRNSQRTVFKAGRALDYEYTNKMNPWDKAMALATSKKKYADGAYYSADTDGKVSRRMNYARYLNKTDHTTKEIYDFADKYDLKLPKFDYDNTTSKERGEGWRAFNKKVETAVNEAYKDAPDAVKAAVYHVITDDTYTKPFGDIPDMTQKNDTGITDLDARENKGYGGRRGRRRRGRRGRGGGGSGGGGTMPTTASGAIKASVTDAKVKEKGRVTNPFKGKISDVSTKSNLDDAYRKKVRQLRNQSRKKH